MAQADVRVGALDIQGTPGTTRTVNLTWPDGTVLGDVDLTVGETVIDGDVDGNVVSFVLEIPDTKAALSVTVDGELVIAGSVRASTRPTVSPSDDVTVAVGDVNVTVATTGPPGATYSLVEDPPGSGLYEMVVA